MAMIRIRKRRITLAQQQFAIKRRYGNAVIKSSLKNSFLQCVVKIMPTPESRKYEVSFECKYGYRPKAYLKNQGLLKSEDDRPPHLYECQYYGEGREKLQLCLYMPGTNEWNDEMLIADTFIPWATEWLYYYEIWRMTGKWLGGGHDGKKE